MTKKPTGFSLIELSIVIVIVSILLTGTLSFSINNANNDKVKLTNDRIQDIYKAMGVYLTNNSKLPCPAAMNLDKSSSSYGLAGTCTGTPSTGIWQSSDTTNYPNVYYGMIPVQTLGLPSITGEDGFGTKFAYMVITGFTNSTKFGMGYNSSGSSNNYVKDATYDYTQTDMANFSPTRLIIKEKPSSSTTRIITNDAMFIIISYGPNRSGGWSAGSTIQNTVSTDDDEKENDVDSSSGGFDGIVISSSPFSDVFDDILFWKTRDQMTLDFDLLHLVSCDISFANQVSNSRFCPGSCSTPNYGGYNSFTWNASTSIKKGEVVSPNSGSCSAAGYNSGPAFPTKRCGAFGLWEADVIDNCVQ